LSEEQHAVVDFNLHDLVGIRLLDPLPGDVAAVERQLGPIQRPWPGEPDITIRFVERMSLTSPLRYLGAHEAGFTDDGFFVLRSKHKTQARVRLALDQIGGPCAIECESGLSAVPLLIPIINLTMLAKGIVPLHASAFTFDGVGVLTTGWSKGGKTEALLAFMEKGAAYVGDEWVYLTPDGKMFGIPEPIRIWHWYLDQLPRVNGLIQMGDRARLKALDVIRRGSRLGPQSVSRKAGRVVRFLERQMFVDMHPRKLFPESAFTLSGSLDKVFWVLSHESDEVYARPIDPAEIARRMVFSLQYELFPFMSTYMMYRFAFPEARNALIESAETRQMELLTSALAGKDAYIIGHPYPAVLSDMFDVMKPCICQ